MFIKRKLSVYLNCKQKGLLMCTKIFLNYQANENIKQCYNYVNCLVKVK